MNSAKGSKETIEGASKELIKEPTKALSTAPKMGRGHDAPSDQEDYEIPRAKIVQGTTAELKDGAKLGTIINSMTKRELPSTFIPIIKFPNSYIQWNPRKKDDPNFDPAYDPGALIFTTTDPNDPRVLQGKAFGPNGEPPKVTKYINFLAYFPGDAWPVVVSFAKTSFAAGRRLNSLVRLAGGDLFSNQFNLKSVSKDNAGTSYYLFDVMAAGKASAEDFKIAEGLYEEFKNKNIVVHDMGGEESDPKGSGISENLTD